MARTEIVSKLFPVMGQLSEGVRPDFFAPPLGVHYSKGTEELGTQYAATAKNVILNRGHIRSRFGTRTYGLTTSTGTQMLVVNFILSSGVSYVIRFDTDKIYIWNGTTWAEVTGAGPFTGSTTDQWAATNWNDRLLVSNGLNGMIEINPAAGTMATVAGAPGARHLSSWGGRVIASHTYEGGQWYRSRIRWSTKNSSSNWTGTGSGYDDLLSVPGGIADTQLTFVPIDDAVAFAVRSNSIWSVNQTGNTDAPFQFNVVYLGLGGVGHWAVDSIPGAVVFFGNDLDIHVATPGGIQSIGEPLRQRFRDKVTNTGNIFVVYNRFRRELAVAVGEDITENLNTVWKFSFFDKGWTQETFFGNFRSISTSKVQVSGPIDSLTGTIDALSGIIDSLGQSDLGQGMFIVSATGGKYVLLQDASISSEVDHDGASTTVALELTTGGIRVEADKRVLMDRVDILYEASEAQTLTLQYSTDFSAWSTLSTITLGVTTAPRWIRAVAYLDRPYLQLRLTSTQLGKTKIYKIRPRLLPGGYVNA